MRPQALQEQAEGFAAMLSGLLNGTVTTDAYVKAFDVEGRHVIVAPAPPAAGTLGSPDVNWVPLSTAATPQERARAKLWLRIHFTMGLDAEGIHLTTMQSSFGLCVDRKGKGFCPIRVEYDRHKTSKQAAHVQIHGESSGISYAFAAAGQPWRPLQKLHIPVGGRRFRPTLEDFIEFLAQEKLVPTLKPGWKDILGETRGRWEYRQTRAAVRRNRQAAVEQLTDDGYLVAPPTEWRGSRWPVR